jgi:hypothetical protein
MGFLSKLSGGGKMKPQTTTASQPLRIQDPTIGFLNLLGEKGAELLTADKDKLAPLFPRSEVSARAIPECQVLFLYGTLQATGQVVGSIFLRDLIREAGAYVAVVASENPADSYIRGVGRPDGRWSANIVMCLDRRGDQFAGFFYDLFTAMFAGTSMPVAWVELAPQIPGEEHANTPESIMSAEAGQIVFSRSR